MDDYPNKLLEMLEYLAPNHLQNPTIGVLTPGIYNSAYFEHSFLSQQMGVELVEGQYLMVEDGYVHLHKEQRLPVNVDPTDPRLDNVETRTRMAQTFERGLGAVVGYVLPLQHGSWKSGPWPLRGEHLFLLPGESAAWLVRTALCVQAREGRLYVFMPPIAKLEGYLELIAAIEQTAKETHLPVVIEGVHPTL